MSAQATVTQLPDCDFCSAKGVKRAARYDFKTKQGPWADGCEVHYYDHRAFASLGTGKGQRLVVAESV